jgi:SpoVK/Ycf46/Vps4 family AAA+-type ATPase
VSYLLQRLERYEGLVVLATNLLNNVDPAFLRRLHVIVEFPIPAPPERLRIWSQTLPAGAPLGRDLDLEFLAERFELPGGTIRNAALTAAFLAADAGTEISMATLVAALQRELRKMGRLVKAADFGAYAGLYTVLDGDGVDSGPSATDRRRSPVRQ